MIKDRPEMFEMTSEPMSCNVCFWYIPPAFRGKEYTDSQKANVHKLMFNRMNEQGSLIIQQQPVPEYNIPNFWRVTFKGEKTRLEDLDYFITEMDRIGQDIDATMV